MLVMERKQLPEDRREEGEKTAVSEDFSPVLRNQNQVGPVNRQTLGQSHLARRFPLRVFLLLVLTLVILMLDKTIP